MDKLNQSKEKLIRKTKHVKQKGRNVVFKLLFGRTMIAFLLIVLQIVFLISVFERIWLSPALLGVSYLLSALSIIYIVNKEENPTFKIAWAVAICAFPVFGISFYLFVLLNPGNRGQKRLLNRRVEETKGYLTTNQRVIDKLKTEPSHIRNLGYYIQKENFFPTYDNTKVDFFGLGEKKYEALIKDIQNAKKYIFLEYFIIAPGEIWDSILSLLTEKAKEGVEVRILYDGLMSAFVFPIDYPKELAEYGIKAKKFSPIMPFLSTAQNSRDHRKIVVIDGRIAYTGGINLADEYMNRIVRFGHWKDTAIRLEGSATKSFVIMFLQMWNLTEHGEEDYPKYLCEDALNQEMQEEGYVIPFNDDPINDRDIAEEIYLDLIYNAKRSIYITTPYLIIDDDMSKALRFAARRGVDVKILMPHIPDKAMIFAIGRTYYPQLIEAGVNIYEYKPGFVHAKEIVVDGDMAVVGTINLDFRSFYQHFECAALICKNPVISLIEKDFLECAQKSIAVDGAFYKKLPIMYRMVARACRLFAPLI